MSWNCTGGMCRPELTVSHDLPVLVQYHDDDNSSDSGVATSDLTLYIGLAVAFLIFVLVVFIIVRLLKRKRSPHTGYSLASAGYSSTKKTLSYTPDLTSGPAHSGCYEYNAYSDNNSNNSLKSAKNGFIQPAQFSELRPLSEHFYEQPMRVFQPSSTSPAASLGRVSESSRGEPVPASLGVPGCADQQQVTWTRVGESGAKITIPRSSVSLTVPQGAIEPARTEEVWVCAVPGGPGSLLRPTLDNGEVLITPVVIVGPQHLTAHLKKPVVVSIPHIGGPGVKHVRALQCDRVDGSSQWKCVAVAGQEDAMSSTSVYVDSSMCQLVTERLAAFALVANMSDLSCFARTSLVPSSSGCSSLGSTPADPPFRIPLAVKQNLSQLLDPPCNTNNDWRMLAERLGVNRYITFFATQPSPTEAILHLWEARNRESTAVAGLVNTLRGMNRHDAAQVLDMDTSWP